MNYIPLEIWADFLEDQGQDTSALRAWIEIGIISCGICPLYNMGSGGYTETGHGHFDCFENEGCPYDLLNQTFDFGFHWGGDGYL